jgi:hypothetical protein
MTQRFTRRSLYDSIQQEVVAPTPWHLPLWLVDVECIFYDLVAPIIVYDEPT